MYATLRDILLVARFELLRAVRTRRAMAFALLYLSASCAGAYVFVQMVGIFEDAIAKELGVAATEVPGTLTHELVEKDTFVELMTTMTGSPHVIELLSDVPLLAISHVFLCYLFLPFFAATLSAESIAADVGVRTLRYELLRTGRLELVLGRFAGQLVLTAIATLLAAVGVWGVGMLTMRGFTPQDLALWLLWLSIRAWAYGIPFVGLGLAASQLTGSAGWARVCAILGVGGSFAVTKLLGSVEASRWPWFADFGMQLLPQAWMSQMWAPDWPGAVLACAALGMCAMLLGAPRFLRRDL